MSHLRLMQDIINDNQIKYDTAMNTLPAEYANLSIGNRISVRTGSPLNAEDVQRYLADLALSNSLTGENNYKTGEKFRDYPSVWRGISSTSVRSLDNQETSILSNVLDTLPPEGAPSPQPQLQPQPSPNPSPSPSPTPSPQPSPSPSPVPNPSPAPKPQPAPSPKPSPAPKPQPQPQPAPAPSPRPSPRPSPVPAIPAIPSNLVRLNETNLFVYPITTGGASVIGTVTPQNTKPDGTGTNFSPLETYLKAQLNANKSFKVFYENPNPTTEPLTYGTAHTINTVALASTHLRRFFIFININNAAIPMYINWTSVTGKVFINDCKYGNDPYATIGSAYIGILLGPKATGSAQGTTGTANFGTYSGGTRPTTLYGGVYTTANPTFNIVTSMPFTLNRNETSPLFTTPVIRGRLKDNADNWPTNMYGGGKSKTRNLKHKFNKTRKSSSRV
jgi:hypothetical protein